MARLEGNVYVDPAYTSQEAIDALGGTSSITGETLTYNVNAYASGGTTGNVPAVGGTIFYNGWDNLGASIYNDGTYDMVLVNTRSNYLYAVPKVANKSYSRDIIVQVEGGTHQHLALLGRSDGVTLAGDLTFSAKNVHFGGSNDNMGGGDSNDSNCVILGDITFSITDSTSGGSFYVHCGDVGTVDDPVKVTGTVTNFLSTSAFRGIRTGDNRAVYADFDLVVTGSSFSDSLELGYATNNSTWEGEFTMTVSSSTAANIYAFERAEYVNGDNTFTLNIAAGEAATRTATIGNFEIINIASGATVIATTINDADELNIELGAKITTTDLKSINTINVIGELVENDTVLISGLTITDLDAELYVGDVRYEAGKFPGFYEIVGGDLIIHNASSTVLLVNSNYTDGQKTDLGPKGYSTVASAQAAVADKASTTVMVYAMDDEVEPNVFTADVVTKDYTTSFVGEDGETVSLDGFDIIVGDEAADVDSANVSISYTDNINAIKFGNVTGTAKLAIDHAGDDEDTMLGTLDLTGANVGDAQISVDNSVIGDVKLANQVEFFGSVVIKNSTITNVYGGAGANVTNDLTGGNEIENVFAEGNSDKIKLGTSKVGTYMAGLSTEGGVLDIGLNYNEGITADTIIIGGNSNTISSINATFTGGGAKEVKIGGDGDTITGDVDLRFTAGQFDEVVIGEDADSIDGNITVTLAGGTVAQRSNGTFYGLIYGASITDVLDGGEKGTSRVLFVEGNAKVGSVENFDYLSVTGGTLNVASGTDKSEVSDSNFLVINGDILNQRGIQAGTITANGLLNYGIVGTVRDADTVGISLTANFENYDYVMTSAMDIGGAFINTGKVTATGDITVGDTFFNSGELFFKATSAQDGTFTQEGGLALNGNVDLVNTGFISAGSLTGVKNVTTSKLYVTGGAVIDGDITIAPEAEVAFTNKANPEIENGLELSGSIYMADTSRLVVSGELSTSGTKTITVDVGNLIGSHEIVRAEGGVNNWTVKLQGAKAGLYSYVKDEYSVTVYSLGELYVNSAFSADKKIVVDGNTLVYGLNAFASVADAVSAAKSGAKIVVYNDATGMDVAAANFNVELVNSTVGAVTAKNILVSADSTIGTIASATGLTIEADALLTVTDTIPSDLAITIDASEGAGSRLVLDVDPEKVALNASTVTVIGPQGKTYTAMVLSSDPEAQAPAHVGDLYLISSDVVYFRKDQSPFVDGDTFDPGTGDALFNGVNVFATRAEAEAAALANDGTLVLSGFGTGDGQKGSSLVNTIIEFSGGGSGLYGTDGSYFESAGDHTTVLLGTNVTTSIYGINKAFVMDGDFTFIAQNTKGGALYITGNTYTSVMNGDIDATIADSTFSSVYIGYGDFGTNPTAPIDINLNVTGSSFGRFYGINMSGSTATKINANINVSVLDSTVGEHFYVIHTADWVANSGANIYQSTFESGSVTVTMGGSTVTNTLRPGDSLTHGANALQVFNAPTTLHIVATDKSAVTRADWVMEWDTIIIDADARLELGHNLQFQTAYRGEGNDVMDGAGTTIQILVNMSGYEGGTHTVIVSGLANDGVQNQIYVNEDLSNIAVIGDNDLTGQCQLVYSGFRQQDAHWALRRIAVFDKTDDMYVNATYTDDISGTTIGGQELFFGANAHTDFTQAIEYATEWGGTIVVTGGNFDAEEFNGNNVELQKGSIAEIEMGNRKASILKVAAGATFETADGSNMSILDVDGNAVLGDVENFVAITVDKGAEVTFGAVSGSNLALFADSLFTAADLDLSDASITIDVDGYVGGSHIVISTEKITGFNAANVTFVGANADKYSLVENGTDLVLKTTIASDTFVNSEYSVATTGTILEDGTYLEFGFNAFNSLADAVAGLGSAANTVTVTGGTFAEDVQLAGANFVMLEGALAGTIYGCVDDNLSGMSITVESGSIGGIDLTAAGGAYSVSKAAITFGDGITVNGGIIGGGDTTLTIGNGVTTVGSIEGLNKITLQTTSLLNADYIDLNNGVIYVTGSAVASKVGNLTKIISTQAGISGATLTGDPGFSVYKSGNDVYVLDLTRIYVDPNYTEAVTGTTAATGDTLSWGVNAFSNINNAYNALIHGGTLYVSNWGTPGSQAGDIRPTSPASIIAQGPTNFSVCFNNGQPATFDTDVHITITNTSTPQANTALLNGADGNRNIFNGNVYITFNGTDRVNTNTDFGISKYSTFNGDLFQINIDGSNGLSISDDYWFLRNVATADFQNLGLLELNITGVTTRNQAKWNGLFEGDPNLPAGLHVVANIKDSVYISSYPNWSIGLVSTGANARNVIYDVHLSGTTIDGNISGQRTSLWNGVPGDTSVYEGTKTLYIDEGANLVNQAVMFHHIVIDANASLRVRNVNNDGGQRGVQFMAANSSGPNTIEVDVSNYNGEDKLVLSTPTFTGAAFDLVLKGDTEEKFIIGVGRSHGVYIITKGGDVMYNADISEDDNGIAFANTFVHVDEDEEANSNAFNDYDAAKAAIDARPGKNLFVSGIGGEEEFYADGYAVTITDGVYGAVYGSDDEEDTVASVSIKVTGGSFGDIYAADDDATVTGAATIELAGGTFGIPAVYETPEATEDDPNPEPELVEDEVPATISGANDVVNGVSSLIVSKNLSIAGEVIDFDEAFVNANLSVTGDFEADVITIDASKKLTVGGDVEATTIVIDAQAYEGPTKAIAVAGNFENEQPAVTILGDLETYDYRYVEDTLYLVSKNAGNVYLNADWDESISGTIYNGELLVFGVNAFNSMNDAILKTTSDYTMYVLGGVFNEVYDLTGIGQVNMNITGGTFGGFIVGDGANGERSTIRINEGTVSNAVSIGSITGVEGSTVGYRVIAAKDTVFGTIDGIRYLRFGAGQNVSVTGGISYIEIAGATEGLMSAGDLVIDFAGYTAGAGILLQTADGIANYIVPTEFLADGTPVSRVVIGVQNNGDMLMPYYDADAKAIIAVARGEFAYLDANASAEQNGTVVTIDGKSATQVYGYNLSNWNVNAGRYAITGGTLFADGGEDKAFYWFFTAAPINVNVKNLRTGGFVAGYNDDSAADQKYREGDFTAIIDATTITWFAAIAGQGNDGAHQEMVVAKYNEEEEEYEDVAWNITISNGTHDTNDFRIARYANLSGGTINVTISDYLLRGDLMLFDRVFNGHAEGHQEELKEVNVTLSNVQEPAAKWIQVWEPQEANSTKINLTITNMNLAGDNTSTIGLFGVDTTGSWTGEADVYISGLTNANGNLNGGRGQTGGGLDNITGVRRLHVVGGTNRIATVREFNSIEIVDGAMLTGTQINMSEGEGFILRGEAGYTGDVKEFAVVGNTITGVAQDAAQFLDEDDYEIDGYKAVVGSTSVFIYKTAGDVYFSNEYTEATTGTAITDVDGTKNFLVYGDNAVISMKTAYASVDARDGKATIQVMNALTQYLYTNGYKTVVNGGQITTVAGGTNYTEEAPAETVDSVDVTINKGATVTNVVVANEFSQVSGDALITVADGVAFSGNLDGASDFVGSSSVIVFNGDASAKTITGFDNVTLNANGEVTLSGAFTGEYITIDATDFADFSKKVLVANGGFGDVTAITVNVIGEGFGYQFLDDGVTLLITSDLVGNVFANADWTEADVHNKFVGDMALVWDKNAFNSFAAAAAAIGEGSTLYVEGGASAEDVTLTKSNDVIVSANTAASSIGSITADGGAITIANDFTANALTGFTAVNFNAGLNVTVGNLELAEGGTLTIDVTGYKQADVDAVVLTVDSSNLTSDSITLTGEGAGVYHAYVDALDNDVHLMRIDNFYVDVDFGTAGEGIVAGQTNSITGEKLLFGVNAFYYLNDALGKMAPGQNLYINNRKGNNVSTGDRIANLYITDSVVPVVINGYTSGGDSNGSKYYVGDMWVTIEGSTFGTAAGSYLFGTVNNNEGWNHQNHIFGSATLNVTGSTMGGNPGDANMTYGYHYTHFYGTEENPALVTFNFTDSVIRNDICFIGDSPVGRTEVINGQTYTGADVVINLNNVEVPAAKWWRFQTGNQESQGTVTFNIKNSNFATASGTMRLALDDNWGTGWGAVPTCHSDFVFNVEDTTFKGYLLAGRLDYGRDDSELTTFDGAKTLNLAGDVFITNTYWFKEINMTADATFTGSRLRMASTGATINIDATGFAGKSKIVIRMDNAFENVGANTIVVTEDPESEYEVMISDRAVVIKGALKDIYVNSDYTAETCVLGTVYNDELLFFGENAFGDLALATAALTDDAVLYVTGGALTIANDAYAFTNSVSVDATAQITYKGSDAITIDGALVNNGSFMISAKGFVDGTQTDVKVLSASLLSGTGTFKTDDASYLIKVVGNEVHLSLKKTNVYVNTSWAGLADGTEVSTGDTVAIIGEDAFATADAAAASVLPAGSITVLASDVAFSSAIVCSVVAASGSNVQAAVGTGSATGTLTVQSGAVASNISVRAKGTLTVDAGAKVTGGLGMINGAAVSFAAGSVLDFDISAMEAGASATVTNLSILTGAPNYTITLAAAQAEGTYNLATDAASFNSSITLMVGDTALGAVSLSTTLATGGYVYTLGLTDNNVLALTIEEGELPDVPTLAYVNSEWAGLEDGTVVTIGAINATIGYDAFADLGSGIAGVTEDGSVLVAGGEVSFADGYHKTITVASDATVIGTASFLNRPITINGTMAFDVALTTRTTAQFADVQFISGDTQYTLTVDNPAAGVYMLASGLWYDDLYQPVFNGSVVFGDAVLTVGNDVQVGDYIYGLRTTSNLELMLVVDKAVAPTTDVTYLTAGLDGFQNMIGRMIPSETAGFESDIKFYTLDSARWGMTLGIEDGWTYAGVGDFNGDGMDDILRYNTSNGLVVADNSNGNGTFTPAVLNFKNASWDILGTGDFNGDGFDDVLVANRTAASSSIGLLGYWANGTTWTLINGYSDEWTLVDTGDYDGNGCTDMLWKNSFVGDGGLTYNAYCTWRLGDIEGIDWSIVMVAKVNETETPDTDAWSFLATGDFNGDGIDDIAMVNDVGMVAINAMAANGTSLSWTTLDMIAEGWSVAGVADLNLDGTDDMILCTEVEGVGSLAGYWQITADEQTGHPTNTWKDVGWLV